MNKSLIFWTIMLLWLLLGFYWNWDGVRGGNYGWAGGSVMLFVLLGLLGWRVFGSPVKD